MNDENEPALGNRPNFDEKPIGYKIKFSIPEYAQNEQPAILQNAAPPEPLPLPKRINSKVWKVKKEAFQELLALVKQDSSAYRPFEQQTVEFITFNHIVVQERALKVLSTFLSAGQTLSIDHKLVIRALIEKCLILDKEQIKKLSEEILFWFMDNQAEETLIFELNEELLTKNPKVLAITYTFLATLLNNYGIKRLKNLQKFQKNLNILSTPPKPLAKAQAVQFYKEVYKWMGDNCIKDFKMHIDFKEEVVKFSKQHVRVPMEIKRGLKKQVGEGKKNFYSMESEDDQCIEPMDVLTNYNARWVDQVLEIEKWKDKKAALDEFIKKTRVSVILPRQTTHFITLIKRLLMDNNINVLQCGFLVIQNLSKGLKKNFTHVCKNILSLVFSKLKDAKAMIVAAAQTTLKSMLNCVSLEDMLEDVRYGLEDKASNMRYQTLKFIGNFTSKKQPRIMNNLRSLLEKICKMTEDGSAQVRNESLELLCNLKKAHDMKFFGDRLKNLASKKIQVIQSCESSEQGRQMMEIEDNIDSKQITAPRAKSRTKIERQNVSSKKLKQQQVSVISSQTRNRIPKPQSSVHLNDLSSPHEAIRLIAYQNIVKQNLTHDLIYTIKSKAIKESSPNILKVIIQIIKKYSGAQPIQLESLEFLCMHDWRKCKNILTEFIQTNKFTLIAEEYIKNNNLALSRNQPNLQTTLLTIKMFSMELQNLMPKMSNPHRDIKLEAVEQAIKIVDALPKIVSETELGITNGWNQQLMNQFYNVAKFRLCEADTEISSRYCRLLMQLIHKGIAVKNKGIRLIIPTVLHKLRQNVPEIKALLFQLMQSNPTFIFSFIAAEICNENNFQSFLDFIIENNQMFIKYAELKNYMAPFLHVLFNFNITQRGKENCQKLLDQMVELCGQSVLEEQVRKSKISNAEPYLSKFNITITKHHHPAANITRVGTSKTDRLKMDEENPWPITATPSHILKLINTLVSLKDPLPQLATPLTISHDLIDFIHRFQPQFMMENSDLLFKWVYWRTIIDPKEEIEQILRFATSVLMSVHFSITESQVIILLSSMINCFKRFHRQSLKIIAEMHFKLFMIGGDYKNKSFRFWINSLSDQSIINPPIDQILQIFILCYPQLIGHEIVLLARIPGVLKNLDFNHYLMANFDEKLLNVYGFKNPIDPKTTKNQGQIKLLSDLGGPENMISISVHEKSLYYNIFQKLSSTQMISKINELTSNIQGTVIIQSHLKIMYSVIVPFLKREISYINIYTYFKELNKFISTATGVTFLEQPAPQKVKFSPYLLDLTRMLLYFLIDLDESSLDNKSELIKVINKIILILLQNSDSRHMLEVLFIILKSQIKSGISTKLLHLLPKCIGKATKNTKFKLKASENIGFIIHQMIALLCNNRISSENMINKPLKAMFQEIANNHRLVTRQKIQQIIDRGNIYEPALVILKEISLTVPLNEPDLQKSMIEMEQIQKKDINAIKAMGTVGMVKIATKGNEEQDN